MEPVRTIHENLRLAKQAESEDDYEEAIELYQQVVKADNVNEPAYERLMILYRRLKFYKEELKVINAGIKAFEKLHKPAGKSAKAKKIAALSQKLLRSTGLADKKGNMLYEPEPIARWKKRKAVVEKKLAKG